MQPNELRKFQETFANLTEEKRKEKFATERDWILQLSTKLTSDRLCEVLLELHPDNYPDIFDHIKAYRKEKRETPLDFNCMANIFPTLKTADQALKLCEYCKETIPTTNLSIVILSQQLATATPEVRVTTIKSFHERIKTAEDFRNVLLPV